MNQQERNTEILAPAMAAARQELAQRVARLTPADGLHECAIEALTLIRASETSQPLPSVYDPSICIVVQGRKCALVADDIFTYDPLNYLVISVTLPVTGQIIEASAEHPYLCLRLRIDPALIGELAVKLGPRRIAQQESERGLYVAKLSEPLLDATLRLVRLLDTPEEIPLLANLVLQEIHYRVLVGELGSHLREISEADSQAQRISRVIELLKSRFAQTLRIEELAAAAHMSPSSLHHRFKAVTAMSPLQFQKQLRLHEARRLMLTKGLEAAVAGHRVGYESPSQFSRDYRRLFGAPPRKEIAQLRTEVSAAL